MKRKLLVILAIVILLAAYSYLGTGYTKQRKEQQVLASQITDVTQVLAQAAEPPQDLEQRLADTKARLAAVQRSFPTEVNSNQVINSILRLAERCHVTAVPLTTEPWSTEEVGGNDYPVFQLNITASGSYPDLVRFISELGTGDYKTLVVDGLSIARVAEEGGTVTATTVTTTADLSLIIYTQPPASD